MGKFSGSSFFMNMQGEDTDIQNSCVRVCDQVNKNNFNIVTLESLLFSDTSTEGNQFRKGLRTLLRLVVDNATNKNDDDVRVHFARSLIGILTHAWNMIVGRQFENDKW